MPNVENFIVYDHWQFDVIRHIFALTVAVFLAGLVYFIATMKEIAPRYRLSSVISGVVMVSAALEIGQLWLLWNEAFVFDPETGRWVQAEAEMFSNGYRYVNWSIDVPMLLTQLLVVLGLAGAAFWSNWWKFTIAGLLMIWTGYVGQYYEPTVAGFMEGPTAPFYIWFAVSTVFYVYIVYLVYTVTHDPNLRLSERVGTQMSRIFWLLAVSWTIYPIAYIIPAFWPTGDGIVARQVLFTIADITSKLVFGVMLSRAARHRSQEEGYAPALAADGHVSPDRAESPARGAPEAAGYR